MKWGLEWMEKRLEQLIVEFREFRSEVSEKFTRLEIGQADLKGALKLNAMLIDENFVVIRKKLQDNNGSAEIEVEVDLLFREIESLKRQINKIEQKLIN